MRETTAKQLGACLALTALLLANISCVSSASSGEFFGKTTPPARNILRYV